MTSMSPAMPPTGRRSGYASPSPVPAPKAPAAPLAPQPKAGQPPVVVIPDCEDNNPDTDTLLTNDASVDDIAAAAGRFRRAAQLAAYAAEHGQAEAEKILEAAKAEVERIIAEAEAKTRPLTEAASAEAKRGSQLSERSQLLHRAAEVAVTAEKAQSAFQALQDEREQLAAKDAELGQRRSVLAAERRDLEAQLAVARDAGDLDTMTKVKTRLAAIEDLNATLQALQAPLQLRMAEIGDGTENFTTHPLLKVLPPLAKARDEASRRRTALAGALNTAMPDRPEAVAAAEQQQRREQEVYDIAQHDARRAEQAKRDQPRRNVFTG